MLDAAIEELEELDDVARIAALVAFAGHPKVLIAALPHTQGEGGNFSF